MVICYLIGCKSRSERKLQDITYHTFPKDSAIRQIWIRATRRLNWQPTKYTRICSRHFVQNCFRKTAGNMTYLKESSIPTLHITEQKLYSTLICTLENYLYGSPSLVDLASCFHSIVIIHSFVLRIISGWPGDEVGEPSYKYEWMYGYYNTALSLVYMALGITYVKLHIAELTIFELTHMYITLLMNVVTTSRAFTLCISYGYRKVARKFIREVHLFYHKDKSEYSMTVHKRMHRISHFFTLYYAAVMPLALLLFNLTPIYNNFKTGKYYSRDDLVNTTYEHAIYIWYPFNSDSNFDGYVIASVINWYGSYLCASSVCMFDLFLSLMVFSLYGHFQILVRLLQSFPIPAGEGCSEEGNINKMLGMGMYSESEQRLVTVKLKQCIDYHRFIVEFTTEMSNVFGYTLLTYFMFHQISGCLLLLQCSQMTPEALTRYVPFTLVMFVELMQLCIIFETIGTMSEKLKDAVYSLPWEYMNTSNRKLVWFFYVNVQEPIHVNAAGLVSVGVTTMASILKTSFSYFAFLRTFSE